MAIRIRLDSVPRFLINAYRTNETETEGQRSLISRCPARRKRAECCIYLALNPRTAADPDKFKTIASLLKSARAFFLVIFG